MAFRHVAQARLDGSHESVAFDRARGGRFSYHWGSIASNICRGKMKFQLCFLCLISQRSSSDYQLGDKGVGREALDWA